MSTKLRTLARAVLVTGLCAASVVAGAPPPPVPASAATTDARPNILIVLTDDQRFTGTMAVMPATRRWFGGGGVRFQNAFATTPLCCPSRASLFSGRYAHNHTVQTNQRGAENAFAFGQTMQAYLHDAGYRTAIFGKYFNAWDLSENPPDFDRWAIESPHRANGYRGGTWNVNGEQRTIARYSTKYIATRGTSFVRASEAHDTQPWFLELATFAPHQPALPERKYADARLPRFRVERSMTERDRSDKPRYVREREAISLDKVRRARAEELRALMSVDDLVARIANVVAETHENRRTLAFFLSDNGTLWGAHGIMGKQTPYLPSIRVPMYARWDGHLQAGSTDRRLAANIDVAPTVLAAAGIQPAAPMDGRSLLDRWRRNRMLLEYWRLKHPSDVPTWAATFTRGYEYVEYDAGGRIVFREYYDLRRDPWELTNLFRDGVRSNDPDAAPLHRQLAADRGCSASTCP